MRKFHTFVFIHSENAIVISFRLNESILHLHQRFFVKCMEYPLALGALDLLCTRNKQQQKKDLFLGFPSLVRIFQKVLTKISFHSWRKVRLILIQLLGFVFNIYNWPCQFAPVIPTQSIDILYILINALEKSILKMIAILNISEDKTFMEKAIIE